MLIQLNATTFQKKKRNPQRKTHTLNYGRGGGLVRGAENGRGGDARSHALTGSLLLSSALMLE